MTLAGCLAAFLMGLALFWFLGSFSGSSRFAMVGALVVVCFGGLANGEGGILYSLGFPPGLLAPAFRRYVPAVPLPFFFIFCGLIWNVLSAEAGVRARLIYGALAWLCFGLMVFSYFYLWTAAIALLSCLAILWVIARPRGWGRDLITLFLLGNTCILWLIPYTILLGSRSDTVDSVLTLVRTHSPDFFRLPEFIGFGVLCILGLGLLTRWAKSRERSTIFIAAMALIPLILLNQQIITGRELQPFHYASFIGNYVVLAALVFASGPILSRAIGSRRIYRTYATSIATFFVISWGAAECHLAARIYDPMNIDRDRIFAVAEHLKKIRNSTDNPGTILAFSEWSGTDLSTTVPQPVLWAWHQIFFSVSWRESKKRYYQYLFYKGRNKRDLEEDLRENSVFSIAALFGLGRYSPHLASDYSPLRADEIEEEADRFDDYIKNFRPEDSPETILSYVIVPNKTDAPINFANIDKWYDRNSGEVYDGYTLYTVKFRGQEDIPLTGQK